MRRAVTILLGLTAWLALVGPAHAAKTYNDPWLEGDLAQMRVPDALDILARTPQHVVVGDIDSGARLSDPDLASHLIAISSPYTCTSEYPGGPDYAAAPADGDFGCDFIGSGSEGVPSTSPDGDPTDPDGHGTGTAAVIAAVPNDGIEGAGVAPNARVLPARACYGNNPDCLSEPTLAGATFSVAMGASVINVAGPPENGFSPMLQSFIHNNANVMFVFPIAGSGQNADPYTLCTDKTTYPNVVCVGSANANDTPETVEANLTTDVSAPGYGAVPSAGGTRREFTGTGAAAAHVAGAAALLRGIAPNLSASTIREILISTSRPVSGYLTANKAGGIVDLETAVRAVQGVDGLTTPPAGQGAPVDSPDPFPGQTTAPAPEPTTPGGGSATSPTTAGGSSAQAPAGPPATKSPSRLALSLEKKLPHSVDAGGTLKLHLHVAGGTGTVTAALDHRKAKLAKATRRHASGNLTLDLRVPRGAKLGAAKLTLRVGDAEPIVRSIDVIARH